MQVGDFIKMKAETLGIKRENIMVIDPASKDVAEQDVRVLDLVHKGKLLYRIVDKINFSTDEIVQKDERLLSLSKVEMKYPFTAAPSTSFYRVPVWAKTLIYKRLNIKESARILKLFNGDSFNGLLGEDDPQPLKISWLILGDMFITPLKQEELDEFLQDPADDVGGVDTLEDEGPHQEDGREDQIKLDVVLHQ